MLFFPQDLELPKRNKLKDITLRGFGGGLNAIDDDISMRPDNLVVLTNFRRTPSGSQKLRFGTTWFADVAGIVSGTIVDQYFFSNSIISVMSSGEIASTNSLGVTSVIWNSAIAALLPGAPSAWSATTTVDFVPFRNTLILHNGVNKPITISSLLVVSYLADLATGSNTNTPIGRFGCTVSNYHCVAGIPAAPTSIYISSRGTSGTFPFDPIPNDSLAIDVGAYAPEESAEIRGIAGFRSNLLVFFSGQTLVVELGVYDGVIHTPRFPDTLPSFGLIGHRCITQIENDILFAAFGGVGSAKRNLQSGLLDSTYLSDRIEPLYRNRLGQLTDVLLLRNCFTIYDRLTHDLTLYTPDGIAFNYSFNDKLKYAAWSKYETPSWVCGCSSTLGRTFLSLGTRIFLQGNTVFAGEDHYSDRANDRDANWSTFTAYTFGQVIRDTITNESFTCIEDHTSGGVSFQQDRIDQTLDPKWELYEGTEIDFEMEFPWLDSKDPMKVKFNKFVSIATKGDAEFTLKAYVDNLFKNVDGVIQHDPAVETLFIGNDAAGFGFDVGPYGGGRRSNDPRLYAFPVKFKSLKPVISGSAVRPLEVVRMTFLYLIGKHRR